jgi:hypothetical protein
MLVKASLQDIGAVMGVGWRQGRRGSLVVGGVGVGFAVSALAYVFLS